MKTYNSAIVLFAVVSCMTGCNKENTPSDPNVIVPVVKGIQATKATFTEKEEQLLFSVPVKSDAGEEYTLEAWISDTECGMPETKGVPITNVNLATAYGSFKTKAYCNAAHSYDIYSSMQDATAYYDSNSGNWSYDKTYKWPAAEYCPLTFCSYAPVGANLTNLSLASGPQASFTYTLPTPNGSSDAVNQKDLLFAMDTHDRGTTGEIDINFKHPLTAVKFTRGDISDCTISSISLVNFYDKGNAAYNGSGWTWTPSGTKRTFTQSFGTVVNNVSQASDASQSGGSLDPDPNESRTFMVIPQNLTSNSAKIEISLGGSTITYDLSSASDTKVRDWSSYAGKTVTFKVNKKPSCYDIILLTDCSRSMSQQYTFDIKNPSRNSYYWTPKEIIKYYSAYSNFISKFKGNPNVKFSVAYFNGATPYSDYGWTTGSKFKACKDNSISLTGSSYIVFHLTNVTNSNFSDLKSYADDKISSCSYDYSAAFCGLQECFWELYHYGQSGSKKIIIVISDGVPAAKSSQDGSVDLKFWTNDYTEAINAANLTIDASNNYTFSLDCTSESGTQNPIITSTAKQIKDGYTYNGKTVKAEIYSILTTAPSSSYKTENTINFMKAISSNCPNATSMSSMGSYNDNGYYYEIPSNGDLTSIFNTIYNKIMN